jgi:hypothetical protein
MTFMRFGISILLVVVVAACSQLPNPTNATLEAQITETVKLTASDETFGFGISVAVDGDWMVVGAYATTGPTGNYRQGAAYLYQKDETGGWQFTKRLSASDGTESDYFGSSVAISGNTVVVGASGDENYTGTAYIFERNQGGLDQWGEVKKLARDYQSFAFFGRSVAISGDIIIIGSPTIGAAYLFRRNAGGPNNWGQFRTLLGNNDGFGLAVAMSGNTVIVGAYRNDGANPDSNQGAAYLFEREQGGPNAWGQVKKLTASDGVANGYFGWSVALTNSMVVVGARGAEGIGGSAYLFERNQGGLNNWGEVKKFLARDQGRYDQFGSSVAIRGNTVVVGAQNNRTIYGRGSAYLFKRNYGGVNTWGQFRRLVASDGTDVDAFYSVAIGSDTVFVGASGYFQDTQGAVYLFAD